VSIYNQIKSRLQGFPEKQKTWQEKRLKKRKKDWRMDLLCSHGVSTNAFQ
jgi:hypothetical protein